MYLLSAVGRAIGLVSSRERFVYIALILARAFSSVLDVLGIALIGLVTGLAATSLDPSKPLQIGSYSLPPVSSETLIVLVVVLLFLFIFKSFLAIFIISRMVSFLARIETNKATEISYYLFNGDLNTLKSRSKSEILWAVGNSTTYGFSGVLTSFASMISEAFLLILVVTTFVVVDPIATLFVLLYFAVVVLFVQLAITKSLKKLGLDATKGNIDSAGAVGNLVETFREIVVYRKQKFFLENFTAARELMAKSTAGVNFYAAMPRYVLETALMLGVVMFVGFQFLAGQLTSSLVVIAVFLSGGVRIMASLLPFQNAISNIRVQVEQAGYSYTILEEIKATNDHFEIEPVNPIQYSKQEITSNDLSVKLSNVSFQYKGSEDKALTKINLFIPSGSHVAFIGPSGAGKTTIADLILGLIEPTEGEICIGQQKPSNLLSTFPGLVSYVPQNPGVILGTVLENIALGVSPAKVDTQRVLQAVESADLLDFINSLPLGLNTDLGLHSDSISGGQMQRLGLARALYNQPKLIILDEATSALDASSESSVSQSIEKLGNEVTVIVIAHRLSTIQNCDIVFVVDQGSILASGKFSDLRQTVPLVEEYVRLMSFEEE